MAYEEYSIREINFDCTILLQSYFLYKEGQLALSEVDDITHYIVNNKYSPTALLLRLTNRQLDFMKVMAVKLDLNNEDIILNLMEEYLNDNPKWLDETYQYHEVLTAAYTYNKYKNDLTSEVLENSLIDFIQLFSSTKGMYYFLADVHYNILDRCFVDGITPSYLMGQIAISVYDK